MKEVNLQRAFLASRKLFSQVALCSDEENKTSIVSVRSLETNKTHWINNRDSCYIRGMNC